MVGSTSGTRLILVVEDDADSREVTRRMLCQRGYTIRLAKDADEARTLALAERPDLLLSDIALRGDDGCNLLREFKNVYPDLKAIAVSGLVYPADEARCRAAGFTAFISKPVDIKALLHAVEAALSPNAPTATLM